MSLEQYAAELLIVMVKLLENADPKSAAAIEARKLLGTKIK